MADVAVVDASPLIYLTRAGQLRLLRLAAPRIVVPSAVAEEVRLWGADDPVALALDGADWLHIEQDRPVPGTIQAWDLGPGEAAVLTLALAERGVAVLDDKAGRRCAHAHGIPLRGTLGLVLLAKKRGEVQPARPVLMELRAAGMFLSDEVMDKALQLVGE